MEAVATVALCGNPNVGKSTLFNRLTGLRQHTGNWPGKTVGAAEGEVRIQGQSYRFVDLPGCYSLCSRSAEEEITRDYILFGEADVCVVVCDATCLARGLVLVLQILELTGRVIVCVNLMDEAKRKGITLDIKRLSQLLGVPVCPVTAAKGRGMAALLSAISEKPCTSRRKLPVPEESETALQSLTEYLNGMRLPAQWLARTLAEGDKALCVALSARLCLDPAKDKILCKLIEEARQELMAEGMDPAHLGDLAAEAVDRAAGEIAAAVEHRHFNRLTNRDRSLDRILTHPVWGVSVMGILLAFILWLTVCGANVPSEYLSRILFALGEWARRGLSAAGMPMFLVSALIDGLWRTTAWVVAVMLPPMAIFFPLFTLLEDLGYLPRVAFQLDGVFSRCSACGKQGLTMCMGLGCNAAGVTGCRIIDSPRERLMAVLTNSFVPCNGRFPILIALTTIFFAGGGPGSAAKAAVMLTGLLLLGALCTFAASRLLAATVLKGTASSFALELPPYRIPRVGQILVRSLLDRTVFVLGRALLVAAPAGLVIWLLANMETGSMPLLEIVRQTMEPLGRFLGMDGAVLMAFLLALPANEILIPIVLMSYTAGTALTAYGSLGELASILTANGWTAATALCVVLFSLLHWPCGTTLLTIHRETGSWRWTALAAALPTAFGITACLLVRLLAA